MRVMRVMLVVTIVAAACGNDDPTSSCGAVPLQCDGVYGSEAACPGNEICSPTTCGSYDCCWCEDGEWQLLFTDCFEGCPGNEDAGVDAVDATPVCSDPAPVICDGVYPDQAACPGVEICLPHICGAYDCCWCDGTGPTGWATSHVDCFEGCGQADASVVDAP